MLCPFCQRESNLTRNADSGIIQCSLVDCPGRDFEVPSLYLKDYEKHLPIAVSIIGPTNHGKTMFIEGLLTHLEEEIDWPRFSTQWMDETNMAEVRQRLRELRGTGAVARATGAVFPRPRILRLRNIPRIGGCQLLMYDTGGEAFRSAEAIQEAGSYIRNSRAIVWIVSLTDLQYPQELGDFMTSYAAAMERMGTDSANQAVIVALTKGDRLANPGSYPDAQITFTELPETALKFLQDDRLDPANAESWARLEEVHDGLQLWLLKSPIRNSVNLILDTFKEVRFCILSAQGSEAINEQLEYQIMPRGILSPLFWLWRLGRPGIWVQSKSGQRELYPDFATAIEAAPDQATIELEAGTISLDQTVMITKPLTIRGLGSGKTKILSSAEKFAFGIRSPLMKCEGISFGRFGEHPGDVFRVSGGKLVLESCEITEGKLGPNAPGYGLAVKGAAEVILRDCKITRNATTGLRLLHADAKVSLERCELSRNRQGLVVSGGCAELTQCEIIDQTNSGVEVQADGLIQIQKCNFKSNGKNGVCMDKSATSTARVSLKSCVIQGHSERGIDLQGQGKFVGEQLTVHQNGQAGLRAIDSVRVEVTSGLFTANQFGLVFATSATGILRKLTIESNLDSGILFAGEAQGWVIDCTLRKHSLAGLRVEGKSVVEHAGCHCSENLRGDMMPGTQAILRAYQQSLSPPADTPTTPTDTKAPTGKRKGWW